MNIIAKRRAGKTTALLKMADDKNGYIVCPTRQMAKITYETAKREGYDINHPLTPWDVFTEVRGTFKDEMKQLYIDDAELVLQAMTRHKIEAVTMSMEDDPWKE